MPVPREFTPGAVAASREGAFTPCEPKLVTRAMLGAINWTARWFRSDGPRPATAVADGVAEFIMRGLSGEATGKSRPAAAETGGRR